jgi:hypothetical protein
MSAPAWKCRALILRVQEKEKNILAECELKRLSGELKTYVASTGCSNRVIIQADQEAGDPAMNFIYLITAYRRQSRSGSTNVY